MCIFHLSIAADLILKGKLQKGLIVVMVKIKSSQSFLSVSSVRPSGKISLFIHDSAAVSVTYSIVCIHIILSFNFIRQIGLYKLFLLRMHS